MSNTSVHKQTNNFFRLTWESVFVALNLIIYVGCLVFTLLPGISAETAILFFFGSSMGLYILFIFSALIVNTFSLPVRRKSRPGKAVTELI